MAQCYVTLLMVPLLFLYSMHLASNQSVGTVSQKSETISGTTRLLRAHGMSGSVALRTKALFSNARLDTSIHEYLAAIKSIDKHEAPAFAKKFLHSPEFKEYVHNVRQTNKNDPFKAIHSELVKYFLDIGSFAKFLEMGKKNLRRNTTIKKLMKIEFKSWFDAGKIPEMPNVYHATEEPYIKKVLKAYRMYTKKKG